MFESSSVRVPAATIAVFRKTTEPTYNYYRYLQPVRCQSVSVSVLFDDFGKPTFVVHLSKYRVINIIILCDIGEGLHWHRTRTAAPAAASRFLS